MTHLAHDPAADSPASRGVAALLAIAGGVGVVLLLAVAALATVVAAAVAFGPAMMAAF